MRVCVELDTCIKVSPRFPTTAACRCLEIGKSTMTSCGVNVVVGTCTEEEEVAVAVGLLLPLLVEAVLLDEAGKQME